MTKYVSVKETCRYLGIGRATLYRLVTERRLTSYKIDQRRCFKQTALEAYKNYKRRIKYPGLVFTFPVLTRYHQARNKYQIITKDKGAVGWISLNKEYLKSLSKKELARQYGTTPGGVPPRGFKPIKYHRVYLEGKYPIIVVRDRDFDRLPRVEKSIWLRCKMKYKRILEEIKK